MAPMKKTLLFQHLTWTALPVALCWRLFRRDAAYCRIAASLDNAPGRRALALLGVQALNLGTLPCDSPYAHLEICHRLTSLVLEALYPDDRAFWAALPGFPGVPDARAVKIAAYECLAAQLGGLARLLAATQSLAASGVAPRLFAPLTGLERLALRLGHPEIHNACLPFAHALAAAARLPGAAIRRLRALARTFSRTSAGAGDAAAVPPERETDPAAFEVLFFPHQSPAYGSLFLKDYYYDPDPDSPLARENVLHVEYGSTNLDASLAYYREHGLHHAVLGRCAPTRLAGYAAAGLLACAGRAGALFASLGRPRADALGQLLYVMVAYRRHLAALAPFRRARLAIAGYDFLFPRTLALALQSRGIRVVAAQERFLQPFFPNFTAIFDLYLVTGRRVAERVAANPLCRIGTLRAIGCARRDLLASDAPRTGARENARVLVLDFHSPKTREESRLTPSINWESNRAFYQDILRLARRFPQARFTIRGKNDDWCALPFFAATLAAMTRCGNIEISHDYATLNASYHLARDADLVLARHTSLGDEAMAEGIPALFHDYAPHCPKLAARLFDYDGYPVFAHDYETLERRLDAFLRGEPLLPPQDFERMREAYYAAGQGPVRERLLTQLRRIFSEA